MRSTGSAGNDKITSLGGRLKLKFSLLLPLLLLSSSFFFLNQSQFDSPGYLVSISLANTKSGQAVVHWSGAGPPPRRGVRRRSVSEPLRQPETGPVASSVLHANFWVANIRVVRTGSCLVNDAKICNKKWVLSDQFLPFMTPRLFLVWAGARRRRNRAAVSAYRLSTSLRKHAGR